MQQLMPYLSQHVADEVAGGVRSLPRLHMALRLVKVRGPRSIAIKGGWSEGRLAPGSRIMPWGRMLGNRR